MLDIKGEIAVEIHVINFKSWAFWWIFFFVKGEKRTTAIKTKIKNEFDSSVKIILAASCIDVHKATISDRTVYYWFTFGILFSDCPKARETDASAKYGIASTRLDFFFHCLLWGHIWFVSSFTGILFLFFYLNLETVFMLGLKCNAS